MEFEWKFIPKPLGYLAPVLPKNAKLFKKWYFLYNFMRFYYLSIVKNCRTCEFWIFHRICKQRYEAWKVYLFPAIIILKIRIGMKGIINCFAYFCSMLFYSSSYIPNISRASISSTLIDTVKLATASLTEWK